MVVALLVCTRLMMKNGDWLGALVEELGSYLAGTTTLDYFQEPIPSAIDTRLDKAVQRFMATSPQERDVFQSLLPSSVRSIFGIYGHRAATRAVREERPDLLQMALIGTVIANYQAPPKRRLEVGLAVQHHAARKLGVDPADAFALAAAYARPDLGAKLVEFGKRDDVTLQGFGWKEVATAEGLRYQYSWR